MGLMAYKPKREYHFRGKKMAVLNNAEQLVAKYVGEKRYESNRANNVAISKIGPQSHEDTEVNGVCGEIAFCKIFNIYPDFEIVYPAPIHDAILNGYKIDVKTTVYQTGRLLVEITKRKYLHALDYFALMIGEFPQYWFIGYMAAKDIMVDSKIIDLGLGDTFAAEQHELWPELPIRQPEKPLQQQEIWDENTGKHD